MTEGSIDLFVKALCKSYPNILGSRWIEDKDQSEFVRHAIRSTLKISEAKTKAYLHGSSWVSRSQIHEICPACAIRMDTLGISRIRRSVLQSHLIKLLEDQNVPVEVSVGYDELWDRLGSSHSNCVANVTDVLSTPDDFCSSLERSLSTEDFNVAAAS